ncbi:MAG: PIG-L deacetylase family protein [Planctomycetia bacterium]|nr:PIG-L deacetylase family protein [Planctomycetia bacterium]
MAVKKQVKTTEVRQVTYDRRTGSRVKSSVKPGDIWSDWQEGQERWLFMSAHDDDIVSGCGLTFLAAVEAGIQVFAGITTNGKMGYCSPKVKKTIAKVREKECLDSFRIMGLDKSRVYFLGFDDGSLNLQGGRRFATASATGPVLKGATGLQNSYTWLLRTVRPTRIFLPSITDLHPDHRMTNSEMVISIFHAQGNIWPELGAPLEKIPYLYEYPTYSNFIAPPELRIRVTGELCERRLDAIYAYKSQEQIELLVEALRQTGPIEFIREMKFDIFDSSACNKLFK